MPKSAKFHAQETSAQLIIMVVVVVFVELQRQDAYYRKDPSKYGLNYYKNINF